MKNKQAENKRVSVSDGATERGMSRGMKKGHKIDIHYLYYC